MNTKTKDSNGGDIRGTQNTPKAEVSAPTIVTDKSQVSLVTSPPTGSLNIKLVQAQPAAVPFWENQTLIVSLFTPILVGILTFFGVWLTVFRADRRMERELNASEARMKSQLGAAAEEASREREHNRNEGHLDRITEGRRTTYLDAVSELVKVQAFLAALPTRDFDSLGAGEEMHGIIDAVGKITVLGSMETVLRARAVNDAVQASFHRCILDVQQLVLERDEIESLAKTLKALEAEQARVVVETLRHAPESEEFASLRRIEDACRAKIAEISGVLVPKYSKQAKDRMDYGLKLLAESKEISRLTDDLIVSVREELNLDTSSELLSQSTEKTLNRATTVLQNARDRLTQPVG